MSNKVKLKKQKGILFYNKKNILDKLMHSIHNKVSNVNMYLNNNKCPLQCQTSRAT